MEFSARINAAVLDIHDGVAQTPLVSFRETCLQRLRALVPFESAIWGSGAEDPQLIFAISVCDFPPDRLVEYGMRWQREDVLRRAVSRRPGVCLRNEDIQSLDEHYASEIYQQFCGPSGIEHALGVTIIDPVTNVGELIFLFRKDRRAVFRDDEREALQLLMPHLASAWRRRLMWHVAVNAPRSGQMPSALPDGYAVVDDAGQVHAADAAFGLRMRGLFPSWVGPLLPPSLRTPAWGAASKLTAGGQAFRLHRGGDRHILSFAEEVRLPLSRAEARVAERFASGMTAQRVAAELGISRATVRNHLTAVYGKLGVHSKVELVRKLGELTPG